MEHRILKRTLERIESTKRIWNKDTYRFYLVVMDSIFQCPSCDLYWSTDLAGSPIKRPINLHTLHNGCIRIGVHDKKCRCGQIVRYDGLTDAIFVATKTNTFTRELLDAWLFDKCGLGMKFRE